MKKILANSILSALTVPAVSSASTYQDLLDAIANGYSEMIVDSTILIDTESTVNIDGKGIELKATEDFDGTILEIQNASSVTISKMDITGNNPFNPDPNFQVGGSSILIQNRSDEDLSVNLSKMTVMGSGDHAIHITDCIDINDCGDGNTGAGEGYDGSISVDLKNVVVKNSGYGGQDADGVRVNERGAGDIVLNATSILMQGVGADGIELDEGDSGDVVVRMKNAIFEANGDYCIAEGLNEIAGTKCDDEGDADVDDAFDIDEAGDGNIDANINNIVMLNNYDEGLDFDEADDGGIYLKVVNATAIDNADEAIKASEEDAGDAIVSISAFKGPRQDLEVEQEDTGMMDWKIKSSEFDDAKPTAEDTGKVAIRGSSFDDVKFAGDLTEDDIDIKGSTFDEVESD